MADLFPKYLTAALENGRLHSFAETSLSLEGYSGIGGTTFAVFYVDNDKDDKQRENAVKLAEKLIALQRRNGGNGILGPEDWFWFKEEQKSRYATERPLEAVKVNCIKFGLSGNIEKAINDLYVNTHVCDIQYGGKTVRVNGKMGYLMRACHTSFLTSCDSSLFKKRLYYSRNDHDGYKWWTTWWNGTADKSGRNMSEVMLEISNITTEVLRMFPDGLTQLGRLFYDPSKMEKISDTEGNLYYLGDHANYHIRLINRRGDYNVYVSAYEKPKPHVSAHA